MRALGAGWVRFPFFHSVLFLSLFALFGFFHSLFFPFVSFVLFAFALQIARRPFIFSVHF